MLIPITLDGNCRNHQRMKELQHVGYKLVKEFIGASPLDIISKYKELEDIFYKLYPNIESLDDLHEQKLDDLDILREVVFKKYGHLHIIDTNEVDGDYVVCTIYNYSPEVQPYQRQKGIINSIVMNKNGESPFVILDIFTCRKARTLLFFTYNIYFVKVSIKNKIHFIELRTNDLIEVGNSVKYRVEQDKYFGKIN